MAMPPTNSPLMIPMRAFRRPPAMEKTMVTPAVISFEYWAIWVSVKPDFLVEDDGHPAEEGLAELEEEQEQQDADAELHARPLEELAEGLHDRDRRSRP